MQIFLIVGYAEAEASNRVVQFLTIVEEKATKKIVEHSQNTEKSTILSAKEHINTSESIDNVDIDARSNQIAEYWHKIAQIVGKEDLLSIYSSTYNETLDDYLSTIDESLNSEQKARIGVILSS
ncbi:hypothetical protein H6763_01760 [Candidatus Nomurabacteria bacterium]|nr:hypothetical protein [Candidatus Nomurabacteria bacterium]